MERPWRQRGFQASGQYKFRPRSQLWVVLVWYEKRMADISIPTASYIYFRNSYKTRHSTLCVLVISINSFYMPNNITLQNKSVIILQSVNLLCPNTCNILCSYFKRFWETWIHFQTTVTCLDLTILFISTVIFNYLF